MYKQTIDSIRKNTNDEMMYKGDNLITYSNTSICVFCPLAVESMSISRENMHQCRLYSFTPGCAGASLKSCAPGNIVVWCKNAALVSSTISGLYS